MNLDEAYVGMTAWAWDDTGDPRNGPQCWTVVSIGPARTAFNAHMAFLHQTYWDVISDENGATTTTPKKDRFRWAGLHEMWTSKEEAIEDAE